MLAVNDILLGLATPHVEVPEALLSAAREQREAVIEALLPVLDAWVVRAEDPGETPSDEDGWLPDYAMFLLAEFREPRAFDFFVRLCELDEDASDQWLGDMLTEDMQAWLASTCLGREETLYALMADEQRYEWSRHAACDALLILAVNRGVALDTFVGRLVDMANAQSRSAENAFWNALASLQYDLRDDVLMSIVRAAYDDALVDDLHITRHELEQRLSARPDDVLGSIELIRDIVRDAGKGIARLIQARNRSDEEVSSFDEGVWDEVPLPYVREGPKVGRNDPCPCGSGRKYKKCCLA